MQKSIIGVIGAQGSFGKHLCGRLVELDTVEVLGTKDKEHSKEIVEQSDIVAIAVRPGQVRELLNEVRDQLKPDAIIVSFAALYPIEIIAKETKRHVSRVLGDPDGWACAYLTDAGFPKERLVRLLKSIHSKEVAEMKNEEEIDRYSVLLSYLLVVLVLRRQGQLPDAQQYLEYLSREFKQLGCNFSVNDLIAYPLQKDTHLDKHATPGGITQRVMSLMLELNHSPDQIFIEAFEFVKEKKAQL